MKDNVAIGRVVQGDITAARSTPKIRYKVVKHIWALYSVLDVAALPIGVADDRIRNHNRGTIIIAISAGQTYEVVAGIGVDPEAACLARLYGIIDNVGISLLRDLESPDIAGPVVDMPLAMRHGGRSEHGEGNRECGESHAPTQGACTGKKGPFWGVVRGHIILLRPRRTSPDIPC